jgi:hypothetical protein
MEQADASIEHYARAVGRADREEDDIVEPRSIRLKGESRGIA